MNISRGMFRLWLVASMFWVAFVGFMTYETLPAKLGGWDVVSQEPIKPAFDPSQPYSTKPPSDVGLASQAKPGMFDDLIPKKLPPTGSAVDQPTFDPVAYAKFKRDAEATEQIKTGIAMALIVPGTVLVVGSLLLWAFRGFRRAA